MLRSAAAFNVAAIITTKDHGAHESAVMAKAACGSLDYVPLIEVTNLASAMREIKDAGYWIYGLDGRGERALHEHKISGACALVMGAEGSGMRRLTSEHCDVLIKLPMDARMESLNVSNAAAIALYHLYLSSMKASAS
jgi:23S rRNA (guanosine2251-2'-O)-methyltransferase